MGGGTWALFDRTLRRDLLGLKAHIFRAVFIALVLLMLLFSHSISIMRGAPGLTFFSFLSWLNAACVVLAGVAFFSSAVAEDREESTLGLLEMAGISRLGLLLGKSTGHLLAGLTILAMQVPFTLLSITLGGVTTHQILAMTAALGAGLIFIANLALFCSVTAPRPSTAAVWTAVLWSVASLVPWAARTISGNSFAATAPVSVAASGATVPPPTFGETILEIAENSSMPARIGVILQTGFRGPVLSGQVVLNTLGGIALFCAAWGALVLRSSPAAESRRSGWGLFGAPPRRKSRRMPTGSASVRWKDFRLISGGGRRLALKCAAYGLVVAAVVLATGPNGAAIPNEDRALWMAAVLMAALTIEAAWLASRILHDEVREQTLAPLLLVPIPTRTLLMQKAAGGAIGLLPAMVALVAGCLILPEGAFSLGRFVIAPSLWSAVVYFLFVLHFTVLMSLTFEWWWVSLGIALGACFFSWPIWIALAAAGPAALCLVIPNTLATFGFVVWMQLGIVKAVERAGER